MLSIDLIVRTAVCIFGSATVIRDFTPLNSCRCSSSIVHIYSPFLTPYVEIPLTWTGSVFLFSPTKPSSPTIYHSKPFPLPNSKPFEIKIYRLRRFSTAHAIYCLRGFHPFLPSAVFCDLWHFWVAKWGVVWPQYLHFNRLISFEQKKRRCEILRS